MIIITIDSGIRKIANLQNLKANVLTCHKCRDFCLTSNKKFDNGAKTQSPIMIVGGIPEKGKNKFFLGKTQQFFAEKFLSLLGVDVNDVYTTNITKCELTDKSKKMESIKNCKEFLVNQIHTIDPIIIVTIGKTTAKLFNGMGYELSRDHGLILKNKIGGLSYHIISTFNYSKNNEEEITKDLVRLLKFLIDYEFSFSD